MRLLKMALLGGAVFTVAVLGSHAPASANSLIASLGKGLKGATSGSSVILVQRRRRRRRGGAAAAAGAAAAIGIIGGLIAAERNRVIEECLERHRDVDAERGVWYDRRGRERPCP